MERMQKRKAPKNQTTRWPPCAPLCSCDARCVKTGNHCVVVLRARRRSFVWRLVCSTSADAFLCARAAVTSRRRQVLLSACFFLKRPTCCVRMRMLAALVRTSARISVSQPWRGTLRIGRESCSNRKESCSNRLPIMAKGGGGGRSGAHFGPQMARASKVKVE